VAQMQCFCGAILHDRPSTKCVKQTPLGKQAAAAADKRRRKKEKRDGGNGSGRDGSGRDGSGRDGSGRDGSGRESGRDSGADAAKRRRRDGGDAAERDSQPQVGFMFHLRLSSNNGLGALLVPPGAAYNLDDRQNKQKILGQAPPPQLLPFPALTVYASWC